MDLNIHRSTDTYAHRPIDPQTHVPADPQTHTRTAPESHRAWSMEHRHATCTPTVGTGVEGTRQEQILGTYLKDTFCRKELGGEKGSERSSGEGTRKEAGRRERDGEEGRRTLLSLQWGLGGAAWTSHPQPGIPSF